MSAEHCSLLLLLTILTPVLMLSLKQINDSGIMECSSDKEISFIFRSFRTNEVTLIADCFLDYSKCYLFDETLAKNYRVIYTDQTILFVIRNISDDTFGAYTCFERYGTNNDSIDIVEGVNSTSQTKHQTIDLRTVEDRKDILKCSMGKDVALTFTRSRTTEEDYIADCFISTADCYWLNDTFSKYYSVIYTHLGVLLIIKKLNEDTFGTYTCHELYTNNKHSIEIEAVEHHIVVKSVGLKQRNYNANEVTCVFDKDITFAHASKKTGHLVIVATCHVDAGACYLQNSAFTTYFRVTYTGNGGTLIIKQIREDTLGTYTCYETLNSSNSDSIDIEEYDTDFGIGVMVFSLVVFVSTYMLLLIVCCGRIGEKAWKQQ